MITSDTPNSPSGEFQPQQGAAHRPLPVYRSFKTVSALKIADIEEQRPQVQDGRSGQSAWPCFLHFEDHTWAPRLMPSDWVAKHRPQVGGYWVQYEDGYESFSPAKAFEAGYILAADWGPRYQQDPKYTVDPATGRRINGDTRRPVPDDEPTMMFRAKDAMALEALHAYRYALAAQAEEASRTSLDPRTAQQLAATLESVDERIAAFRAFREAHQDVLRNPT